MPKLTRLILIILLSLSTHWVQANDITAIDDDTRKFGPYTLYFSIFNSLSIPPEVANIHHLVRAKNQALINVAIKETTTGNPVAADVSATATNLMQQSRQLEFKEIEEPGAVYYIGSFRHTNEELVHMDFDITVPGEPHYEFRVTRKLYTE